MIRKFWKFACAGVCKVKSYSLFRVVESAGWFDFSRRQTMKRNVDKWKVLIMEIVTVRSSLFKPSVV